MASPDRKTEVRVMLDYELARAYDNVAQSRRMTTTEMTRWLIHSFTVAEQRKASVISQGPVINPAPSDSGWSPLE